MGGSSSLRSILPSGLLRSAAGSGCRGYFLEGCPSGCGGRWYRTSTHVHTPLNNPRPLSEGDLTEIEVTDPTHPLFGRRFPLLSAHPQAPTATHVFVTYQGFMVLRIPRAGTNLLPQLPRVSTTLTSHAITDLIALAEQCEVLCPTPPGPSGPPSAPSSKPRSTPNSRPSSRR
jgi:hypothetical protein